MKLLRAVSIQSPVRGAGRLVSTEVRGLRALGLPAPPVGRAYICLPQRGLGAVGDTCKAHPGRALQEQWEHSPQVSGLHDPPPTFEGSFLVEA